MRTTFKTSYNSIFIPLLPPHLLRVQYYSEHIHQKNMTHERKRVDRQWSASAPLQAVIRGTPAGLYIRLHWGIIYVGQDVVCRIEATDVFEMWHETYSLSACAVVWYSLEEIGVSNVTDSLRRNSPFKTCFINARYELFRRKHMNSTPASPLKNSELQQCKLVKEEPRFIHGDVTTTEPLNLFWEEKVCHEVNLQLQLCQLRSREDEKILNATPFFFHLVDGEIWSRL